MLCESKKTIYAMIDALGHEYNNVMCLKVYRSFQTGDVLKHVAEVRCNGSTLATNQGQCLRAEAATEADALQKLAAMCCLVS